MTSAEKIDLIARTDPFKLVDEAEHLRDKNEQMRSLLKRVWTVTANRDLMEEIERVLGERGPFRTLEK